MQDWRSRIKVIDYLLDRPFPLASAAAVLLAAVLVAVDWMTWVELDVSAAYGVPLVLAALARNRRLLWCLAPCVIAVTFAAYALQIGPGVFSLGEPLFINRVLSATALILTAALCDVWIVAASRIEAQGLALKGQNEELDRLRRIAEEASSRKTQLLASVSHDIRTPLSTIEMVAELILQSTDDPALTEQIPDMVRRLRHNTMYLVDLVSALVEISFLDAGPIDIRKSEFSLNELLLDACDRLLPLAQAKGLRLEIEPPEPAVWLLTDRIRLNRVLTNIVSNAIKFTEKGGVNVTTSLNADRSLLIQVRDTGIGMTSENLARIFDEYAQLGNSERDASKGWGLGLAICRRLIDAMGGKIAVESKPNRGTTFSVLFPASCVSVRAIAQSRAVHREPVWRPPAP